MQGYGVEELARMPQIISGLTPEAVAKKRRRCFGSMAPEIVTLDPIEAEFAKLFGNAYRYIEFAIDQSVLPDRKIGGARLPAYSAGDEAQLSPRQEYSDDPVTRPGRA